MRLAGFRPLSTTSLQVNKRTTGEASDSQVINFRLEKIYPE